MASAVFLLQLTTLSLFISGPSAIPAERQWRTYAEDFVAEPPLPHCRHPEKFETNWILQFSNHFAELDPTVWRMRFFSNLDNFDSGGPLFVVVGGPWEISPHFVCSGLVVDAAKSTRGAVFYLEHRFYGHSFPPKQKTRNNFALLSRAQTIEDIRYFIDHQKAHQLGMSKSQVILVGSHLGGSLALWTQQTYPLLVNGVWATGAPLAATDFLPGVLKAVRLFVHNVGGADCLKRLDETFQLVKTEMHRVNSAEFVDIFEMCPGFDFESHYDQSTFLFRLFTSITRSALQHTSRDISDLCYELLDPQYLDVVEAFAPFFLTRQRGRGRCLDYSFRHLLNDTANREGKVDVWAYQSCSEYGWFPGGAENFWLSPNFFQSLCYNAFSLLDDARDETREETQLLFDGIMRGAENMVLSYGLEDPWTRAGLKELPGGAGEKQLLFVAGASFGNTLMSSLNRTDSLDMQEAKMIILKTMEKWSEVQEDTENLIDSGSCTMGGSVVVFIVSVAIVKQFN